MIFNSRVAMGPCWLALVFFSGLCLKHSGANAVFKHCREERPSNLVCSNMDDEVDLEQDLMESRRLKFRELVIANSSLRFLPHDVFRSTSFKVMTIRNTSFLSFSDTDVAFEGLENHLTDLYLDECSHIRHLNFYHLRNLKLSSLRVVGSDLDHVTDVFSRATPGLFFLRLNRNHISWIHPKAFAAMKHLSVLRVGHNEISTIQRSMFPNPTINLNMLDLSYNKLKTLPVDIFTNMPYLVMVNLDGNQLITLDQSVFGDVITKFGILSVLSNPLLCDCRLEWVLKAKPGLKRIQAECSSPGDLRGKSLLEIKISDLWC